MERQTVGSGRRANCHVTSVRYDSGLKMAGTGRHANCLVTSVRYDSGWDIMNIIVAWPNG